MGKLGKLKCMIKRWHSSKTHHTINRTSSRSSSRSSQSHDDAWNSNWRTTSSSSFHGADEVPSDLHPVYVGQTRRRYLVNTQVLCHPLFQTLVERTGTSTDGTVVVGCEVVLFEHLLWMLENADPQPESLDELVEFYAY
ncbi:SAUR-like auxin-responsive protein family [Rhynchospora pubera]|uniref:SAUR-like auxin-responsive protein family n=1 Tax=Rhynchospora pubera TaxID=906938 RepID=A0AAV8BPM6_9POAL|nr:SAUR-like auxin-responsive protein family [Rhynchospora pubera]KAJ4761098.1 SAUR-like auxin-responsive protein family [Rhynchospora pubera]KAJ4801776.1 SAUR-like auxin-responsive protein family [Rhynchospora pubera]